MESQEVFRTNDHIGGILRDGKEGILKAVSWGSRTFYQFTEKAVLKVIVDIVTLLIGADGARLLH
ncbi:hypothetical protein COE25_08100 [Bacillus sp. AFS031507]|nr:hypothetical protein COE25_08100 [Bacillus sp. AFS031507]